jgi:hypothetical protein
VAQRHSELDAAWLASVRASKYDEADRLNVEMSEVFERILELTELIMAKVRFWPLADVGWCSPMSGVGGRADIILERQNVCF